MKTTDTAGFDGESSFVPILPRRAGGEPQQQTSAVNADGIDEFTANPVPLNAHTASPPLEAASRERDAARQDARATSSTNTAAANTAPMHLGRRGLTEFIRSTFDRAPSTVEALTHIAGQVAQALPSIRAAIFFRGPSTSRPSLPETQLVCKNADVSLQARCKAGLMQVAQSTQESERFSSGVIRVGEDALMAVVHPIVCQGSMVGSFGLIGDANAAQDLTHLISLVATEVGDCCAEFTEKPGDPASLSPADTQPPVAAQQPTDSLLNRLVREPDLETAAQKLVEDLATRFDLQQVLIGFRDRGGQTRLLTISNVTDFSRKSPLVLAAEEVIQEAMIRNQPTSAHAGEATDSLTSGAQELTRICNQSAIASGPIGREQVEPWGAWTAVSNRHFTPDHVQEIQDYIATFAACLELFDRARGGRLSNAYRRCRDNLRTKRGLVAFCGLIVLTMLIPVPYTVRCDSEIQPVTRRFVPVPYDGVLKEVLAEPGDEVQTGQVLAKMDRREIELELATLDAEYVQASKQHDSDLASQDTAASQVARLEMQSLRAKMELLKGRLDRLDIKSPIDGVVIGGDPQKKVGARLARGDSLFETGPLSRMVVEVYVPDDEIRRIHVGQSVRLKLDAYPNRTWPGTLQRVRPSAEIRDQENVFVAEFEVENPDHILRPGMHGRARVRTRIHPLGWNLFHKAWEQLVYGWGW